MRCIGLVLRSSQSTALRRSLCCCCRVDGREERPRGGGILAEAPAPAPLPRSRRAPAQQRKTARAARPHLSTLTCVSPPWCAATPHPSCLPAPAMLPCEARCAVLLLFCLLPQVVFRACPLLSSLTVSPSAAAMQWAAVTVCVVLGEAMSIPQSLNPSIPPTPLVPFTA